MWHLLSEILCCCSSRMSPVSDPGKSPLSNRHKLASLTGTSSLPVSMSLRIFSLPTIEDTDIPNRPVYINSPVDPAPRAALPRPTIRHVVAQESSTSLLSHESQSTLLRPAYTKRAKAESGISMEEEKRSVAAQIQDI